MSVDASSRAIRSTRILRRYAIGLTPTVASNARASCERDRWASSASASRVQGSAKCSRMILTVATTWPLTIP